MTKRVRTCPILMFIETSGKLFEPQGLTEMTALIRRALLQQDDLVLVFDYTDSKGDTHRRVVSPIRFLDKNRFLGLCLCREEPRQFYIDRCQNLKIDRASNYTMPVAFA